MVKRDDALALAVALGTPLLSGMGMGLTTASEVKPGAWYDKVKKPKWTPPKWMFPVVWPILYASQGVASWLVWRIKKTENRKLPLILYGVQLVLNLAWQPLFFKAHRPEIALVDSVGMLGLAAAATVAMTQAVEGGKMKGAVAGLMGPYVAWVAFATALTAKIAKDNPDAHKLVPGSAKPTTATPKTTVTPSAPPALKAM